jgi:hypothetical protein
MSDSDEPACGSDRHMVPKKRPSTIGLRNNCFLFLISERRDQIRRAVGEKRIAGGADIGRRKHEGAGGADNFGHLRPAPFMVKACTEKAGFAIDGERFCDLRFDDGASIDEFGSLASRWAACGRK